MFDDYKDILSVAEVCKALNIGNNKAYEMLKNGRLRSIKIGRIHKVPKAWLIEFFTKEKE